MEYDLTLAEETHTIGGKTYVLREATEDVRKAYGNAVLRCLKRGSDDSIASADGLASTEVFLVSRCLFERQDNGNLKPMTEAEIGRWPGIRVVRDLYERAKKLSRIDQPKTKEQWEEKIKEAQEAIAQLEEEGKN